MDEIAYIVGNIWLACALIILALTEHSVTILLFVVAMCLAVFFLAAAVLVKDDGSL